jgi:hypothetical protein
MLRFRLLWVLPGADFGLYFFVKRPQDLSIDATIRIFGHYGLGSAPREENRRTVNLNVKKICLTLILLRS